MSARPSSSPRRLGRAIVGLGASICLCSLAAGCGEPSARAAGDDDEGTGLRSVVLPDLTGFPDSVRKQLSRQHELLESLGDRPAVDSGALGQAYGAMGQLLLAYDLDHAAEPALENAARLRPDEIRWPYYLAHLYKDAGEPERAVQYFQRVLELQPDYVPGRIHLAGLYRDLGRDTKVRAILEETLRIDPENPTAHFMLGHMAVRESPEKAIEHYESVLRGQPEASVVHNPLAAVYRRLGDLESAREHLARRGQRSVKLSDPLLDELKRVRIGAGARIYQGNKLLEQDRYREAAAFFEEAAALDSTNATAFLNLAVAVAQLREFDRARRALEHVLRLDPDNSQAHYNLGILALYSGEGGRGDRALEHFRAAARSDPGNASARIALANLLWRRRRCREAIPHFSAFLEINPRQGEARIKQAICHAHLGEHAEALKLLESGYEGSPEDPLLQDALVRILAASPDASVRDGARALQLAQRLTGEHRRAEMLESLAMAYAESGRFSEAIEVQREVIRGVERRDLGADMLEYLRGNLRRYEQEEPSRTPWPPMVFDQ